MAIARRPCALAVWSATRRMGRTTTGTGGRDSWRYSPSREELVHALVSGITRNVGSSTASRSAGAVYLWPDYGALLHPRPLYASPIVIALKMPRRNAQVRPVCASLYGHFMLSGFELSRTRPFLRVARHPPRTLSMSDLAILRLLTTRKRSQQR